MWWKCVCKAMCLFWNVVNHFIFSVVLLRKEFQAALISANNRNLLHPFKGTVFLLKCSVLCLTMLASDTFYCISLGDAFVFKVLIIIYLPIEFSKYIYWLCYYSCPVSPPSLHSILPTPSSHIPPPIVHVHGSCI